MSKVYALYKGEQFICDGTVEEIAKYTGKTIRTVRFYRYECYKKRVKENNNRLIMIELEDE